MIRVLHVEDAPQVRGGFAAMLRADPALSLVGSATTGGEALALLHGGLDLEVAVVDLGLPDMSGVDVIRALRRARPRAVPLAFTVFDDPEHIFPALRAGARGYLLKHTSAARLLASLKEAAAGGAPMTPLIARRVVESFGVADDPSGRVALTKREEDVLARLVAGHSYARIARELSVTLSTIQTHVRAVYAKLEVSSKAEATRQAIRLGLVRP
jgi:DNA-binding NarL/FixJ family response regulator